MSDDVVHFATSNYTACNQHIVGSTVAWLEESYTDPTIYGKTVQHTALVEQVTCEACKKSSQYLTALEEQ